MISSQLRVKTAQAVGGEAVDGANKSPPSGRLGSTSLCLVGPRHASKLQQRAGRLSTERPPQVTTGAFLVLFPPLPQIQVVNNYYSFPSSLFPPAPYHLLWERHLLTSGGLHFESTFYFPRREEPEGTSDTCEDQTAINTCHY